MCVSMQVMREECWCGRCVVYVWRARVESGQVMSAVSNVQWRGWCGAHDDADEVPSRQPSARHLSRYTLPTSGHL